MAMPGGDKGKSASGVRKNVFDMAKSIKTRKDISSSEKGFHRTGKPSDIELTDDMSAEVQDSRSSMTSTSSHSSDCPSKVNSPEDRPSLESVIQSVAENQSSHLNAIKDITSALAVFKEKFDDLVTVRQKPENAVEPRREIPSGSTGSTSNMSYSGCSDEGECSDDVVDEDMAENDDLDELVAGCGKTTEDVDENDCSVENLLSDLREFIGDDDDCSPEVSEGLAKTVNDSLAKPASNKKVKEVLDKYNRPKNCTNLLAPRVNEEIWTEASLSTRQQDIKTQHLQGMLAKATIPIVQIMDTIMNSMASKKKEIDSSSIVHKAKDALRILLAAQSEINVRRRDTFRPDLNGPFKRLCNSHAVLTTDKLFGDDLNKKIKEITDAKQMTDKLSASGHGGKHKGYHGNKSYSGQRYSPYKSQLSDHRQGRKKGYSGGSARGKPQNYRGKPQSFLGKRHSSSRDGQRKY